MKLFTKILGIIFLLAIFSLAYAAVKNLDKNDANNPEENNVTTQNAEGFSSNKQTVGEVGGEHYIRGVFTEDMTTFHRVRIETALNRPTVLENIETPLSTAELRNSGGKCHVAIHLSDTTEIAEGENIFRGNIRQPSDTSLISNIKAGIKGEGGEEVQVALQNCDLKFKLGSDPKNPGHVWLDVLR